MDATDLNDPLQTCPYEESHRILKSRMQWHLVRCRKNHPCDKSQMKTCPYDVTHIINELEYGYHVDNCAKSGSVVNFVQSIEPQRSVGSVSLDEIINVHVPPPAENWDNDPPEKTYDAIKEARNKGVSIPEVGLSKAKKKQFIKSERLRIKSLEDSGVVFNPTPRNTREEAADPGEIFPNTTEDVHENPLRPPRSKPKSMSICSNTDYMNETLQSCRQFNTTMQSGISTSMSKGNPRNDLLDSLAMTTNNQIEKVLAQSSNCSINPFNPAAALNLQGIEGGNLLTSTAFSSSNTLDNVDSNPLDDYSSRNNIVSNSSESNIDEISMRFAAIRTLEQSLTREKEKLKNEVDLYLSRNGDLVNNSRCAANFSNTRNLQ